MAFALVCVIVVWVFALSLTVFGTWLALRHFYPNETSPTQNTGGPKPLPVQPPVSLLKPLKGADSGLEDNLRTFFELDYPAYEILFSVACESDPACEVAQRLIREHPRIAASIEVGNIEAGPNPKVNNLIRTYGRARFDWILVSDSNARVPSDYLTELMQQTERDTGVITAVVAGQGAVGLGGHLEAMYLNTFYARGMFLAAFAKNPCVVGKSMLFRRSVAERFGGIRVLARYLAEDYMTGIAMKHLGLKVQIMRTPVVQHIGDYSFEAFWQRHLRWGRIRKSQAPLAFFFEPLSMSLVSGLLGSFAIARTLEIDPLAVFSIHWASWFACDYLLLQRMNPSARFLPAFAAWIVREFLAVPQWLAIASGKTVNWRGQKLTLKEGGLLET